MRKVLEIVLSVVLILVAIALFVLSYLWIPIVGGLVHKWGGSPIDCVLAIVIVAVCFRLYVVGSETKDLRRRLKELEDRRDG